MAALSTLFPVFFMVLLGIISRIKGFVTPEQKEGANNIVFNVLFPILIFNSLCFYRICFDNVHWKTFHKVHR